MGPTGARQAEFRALMAEAIPKMGGAQFGRTAAVAGVGALGQAAQLGLQLIPTSAERENKRQIQRLQRLERQGMLGLSPAEYYRYQRALMDPVRMGVREIQRGEEARLAGQEGVRSAAGLVRGQREGRRLLAEKGMEAGAKLVGADIQRVAEQRYEKAEREAAQGREEARRRGAVGTAIGAFAEPIAQVMAAAPVKQVDPQVMRKMVMQYGANEALLMANMMQSMGPRKRQEFNTYLATQLEQV
jgi:hypothetical protein